VVEVWHQRLARRQRPEQLDLSRLLTQERPWTTLSQHGRASI
jgi:hypothetical protein